MKKLTIEKWPQKVGRRALVFQAGTAKNVSLSKVDDGDDIKKKLLTPIFGYFFKRTLNFHHT